jgi:hypothetical protein
MADNVFTGTADDPKDSVYAGENQKICLPPTSFLGVSKFFPADFHHIKNNITC